MHRLLLIVLSISSVLIFSCKSQKAAYSLEEVRAKSSDTHYKNIVLIGVGTSSSRMFYENLTDDLNKATRGMGIQFSYRYMGKDSVIAKEYVEDLKKEYDAVMLLLQQSNHNKEKAIGTTANNSLNNPGLAILSSGLLAATIIDASVKKYHKSDQDYFVNIFETKTETSVWSSNLKFNFDFNNPKKYRKISKFILEKLDIPEGY